MTITIAIVNQSTTVTAASIQSALPDLQTQINRDFAPIWGRSATLIYSSGSPPAGAWIITIMDTYSQSNILGYHELTVNGMPIGYVFVQDAAAYNQPWTVPTSHEILEMLTDPDINLSVLTDSSPYQSPGDLVLFSYEICDPVQDISQSYSINQTVVSDFVYPSWFESFWQPFSTQFNYQNTIIVPFQLQTNGYIMTNDITSTSGGWQEIYGSRGGSTRPPGGSPLSRRQRRIMGHRNWRRSNQ